MAAGDAAGSKEPESTQSSYYRGKLFGEPQAARHPNGLNLEPKWLRVSEHVGPVVPSLRHSASHTHTRRRVRRSLDGLADTLGAEFRQLVLSRQAKLTRRT